MPTKPPVATVSPSRIRRTASSAETTLPPCPVRNDRRNGGACLVCIVSPGCVRASSDDAGQVVDPDDDEDRYGFQAGDGENVLVGLAMGQSGHGQQRDHRAVVWQRIQAA